MATFHLPIWTICILIMLEVNSSPLPGHHVHHRIYVPQKIKTIYHTKIIKVPEHHHYFHEKEKIIQFETPHHKDDHSIKDVSVKLHNFDHGDELEDFSDFQKGSYYGGEGHNIFKKHAIVPKNHKRDSGPKKDNDNKKDK